MAALVGAGIVFLDGFSPSEHSERFATRELQIYSVPLVFDSLTGLIRWIALGAGLLLTLFGWSEVPERRASEFFACLLLIVAGTSLTAAANDLVVLFLALELVSIPTYVLLYLPRHDDQAQEAAMKYFFISIFSSALLLFGFSYLYGLAGTTNLPALHQALNAVDAKQVPAAEPGRSGHDCGGARLSDHGGALPLLRTGRLSGNGDGCGRPPGRSFRKWLGSSPWFGCSVSCCRPVCAPQRMALSAIGSLSEHVPVLLWFLAVVTMSLGNLLALLQNNVKRLLAYSSVAHAGYMLMALATTPFLPHDNGTLEGPSALFFYLVAYGAMTTGAFALALVLRSGRIRTSRNGRMTSRAWEQVIRVWRCSMTIFLFSLIGIPLTAGFAGKFLIFFGAMAVPSPEHAMLYRVLAVIGVVNAAIGGWYYLRIIAVMYLRQAVEPLQGRKTWPGWALLVLCALATIGFGIPPGADWLEQTTQEATQVQK